jgi:predicted HicB family RNase H-like nuclease
MPSKKPVIALRLESELHERIVQIAKAQGRTPGNWVAQKLREALTPKPTVAQ